MRLAISSIVSRRRGRRIAVIAAVALVALAGTGVVTFPEITRRVVVWRMAAMTGRPAVAENGGTDRHFVPHFLPGTNTDMLTEWIVKGDPRSPVGPENWVPLAAARGGVKTIYPEYRLRLADVMKGRK